MPTAVLTGVSPEAIVNRAIKNITALATLPEVTARIIAIVEDPRSSASSLHKIISHDPALVSRILKLVNSAFYGLPGQISSIDRAIVLLGLNAVKNVAVAASLGQLFRGVKLCEGFTARDLWTHCIAVAVTARELAKSLKIPLVDEAFLAGLIHDVGILVALQVWPAKVQTVCSTVLEQGGDFCAAERQILGVDHQMLGKALAEKWKFPRTCQQAAGFHHAPRSLAEDSRLVVCLVHIADTICCQAGIGFNLTARGQELDASILKEAGLDAAIIQKVTADIPTHVNDAVAMLG